MKVDLIIGGVDSDSNEEANFLSKKKFSRMIEDTVKRNSLSYMDAVIHLCQENMIEVEDVKKYLSTSIKQRIEMEAMNLNFLDKGNSKSLSE